MSRIYRNRNIGEWLPSNGGVGGEQKWGMVANGPKVCLRGSENVLKLEGGLGLPWAFLVAQTVKNLPEMQETPVQPLGWEDALEKETATHSHILAWRNPRTEKLGGLQSMASQRVGHN